MRRYLVAGSALVAGLVTGYIFGGFVGVILWFVLDDVSVEGGSGNSRFKYSWGAVGGGIGAAVGTLLVIALLWKFDQLQRRRQVAT